MTDSPTPFQQVTDELTDGCGCACHTGTGYRTGCSHCYRMTFTVNGETWPVNATPIKLVGVPICPDLLSIEDIGEADNLRGRVVRSFFRAMRWWKP